MPTLITKYDMLISSPSDVGEEEIEKIEECVSRFNQTHDACIRAVRWTRNVDFDSSRHPQESIDEQLVLRCDFGIAIFKGKLGSSLEGNKSGTVKEIFSLREQGKQVFVYQNNRDDCIEDMSEEERENYHALTAFIEKEIKGKGIAVYSYKNIDELGNDFLGKLNMFYEERLSKTQIGNLDKLRTLGITYVAEGSAPTDLLTEKITSAKEIKIFQTTGYTLFHNKVDSFAAVLKKGGSLKVLLPLYYGAALKDVEEIEGRKDPLSEETSGTLMFLNEISKSAGGKGTIEIGEASTLVRQTETICITEQGEIWSWISMTMPPKRAAGEKTVSFACESTQTDMDTNSKLATHALINFDSTWELARKRGLVFALKDLNLNGEKTAEKPDNQ